MAQLARRSQRKLLGQEWTPHWLAHLLADRCIDGLPEGESPRIVDMCCGSGTMLAEIIKAARDRFGFSAIEQLEDVATGFDIDPLAVSLAKATWVVSLSAEIKSTTKPIIIPVYHADSLFAVTPVSASVPLVGESDTIPVSLDGATIQLPTALVQPAYREFFDRIVDWAYDEARDAQRRAAELLRISARRTRTTFLMARSRRLVSRCRRSSTSSFPRHFSRSRIVWLNWPWPGATAFGLSSCAILTGRGS